MLRRKRVIQEFRLKYTDKEVERKIMSAEEIGRNQKSYI